MATAVFGASERAERYIRRLGTDRIARLVDGDPSKQGKVLAGLVVEAPEALKDSPVDEVVILALRFEEVRRTLAEIGFIGTTRLPTSEEFSTPALASDELRDHAACRVVELSQALKAEFGAELIGVFGTALGIVRHGDFIAWDSDIDLMIFGATADAVARVARRQGGVVDVEVRPSSVLLDLELGGAGTPIRVPCTVSVLPAEGSTVTNSAFGRTWAFDSDRFAIPEHRLLRGRPFAVPAEPESYLVTIYGDGWATPRSDWTTEDYGPGAP